MHATLSRTTTGSTWITCDIELGTTWIDVALSSSSDGVNTVGGTAASVALQLFFLLQQLTVYLTLSSAEQSWTGMSSVSLVRTGSDTCAGMDTARDGMHNEPCKVLGLG
jgi:hypothetical protein